MWARSLDGRAAVFAALGEPIRLALVDRLVAGDASPGELAADVGLGSNLLAHHLRVLEDAGIIRRVRSEGDRRRSYVQLRLDQPTVWAAAISGRMPNNLPDRSPGAVRVHGELGPLPARRRHLEPAEHHSSHLGRNPSRPTHPPAGHRRCRAPRTPHRTQPPRAPRRRPSRR